MIISRLTDKLHCWFKAVRAIQTTEKCGNGSIGQNRIENLIGEESQYVYGRRRTLGIYLHLKHAWCMNAYSFCGL